MTTYHIDLLKKLAQNNNCRYLENEPLSQHTTFRIGGKCSIMLFANSESSAAEFVACCKKENIRHYILGNGSNVLFSDDGFDGAVIVIGKDMRKISLHDDNVIEVMAGCTLAQLCTFALENSLTGLEFAYGIPGTVGGAVFMNAGAYGGDISDVIVKAEAFDENGNVRCFSAEDMQLGYRTSAFQSNGYIITKAWIKLGKGNASEIKEKMDSIMERRKEKQPLEYPSAGSAFKRPVGSYAGKLIQESGLRGYTVGGAQVSEKHCGFVINRNNATFSDVETLINDVRRIVSEKTGFDLECEVRIIK